ncbi:MAG: hypothetical protein HY429_03235 [Candidatus Levybacteria bacterium]|nr:hypothetical protein [Candidatus Levybacteria bacterium]
MDPNQTPQPIPQPIPATPSTPPTPKSSSHGVLFAVIAILVVASAVAVFLLLSQPQTKPVQQQPIPTVTLPSPTITPTEQQGLEDIDTGNPEQDLQDIQNDLGEL